MKSLLKFPLFAFLILSIYGCKKQTSLLTSQKDERKKIEIATNYGSMIIELYNETPLHRDNIINLAKNNAYDSLLFHRVINKFMIQAGDPDSKNAKLEKALGNGDLPYLIDAEFNPKLFHKKGVLGAARDDNFEKASSGMQFYIVQGAIVNDSLLTLTEERINQNMAREYFRKNSKKKSLLNSLKNAEDQKNIQQYNVLIDSILNIAKTEEFFKPFHIPEKHREIYKSVGGVPYLDQSYTVFGEVVEGLNIIDSIANVPTNSLDRPIENVIIQEVRLLN